ncbi:hypothetical protein AB0E63_22065 [Kribbella sp. NPDC026596]|uniref:hypothetical protein n=1 Tax=Kribbella sp. NPDC026596 TaxID=3155122 RepID=UPI00340F3398
MIRVDQDGRLTLHRSGIQDQEVGGADVILERLREFRSTIAVVDGSTGAPMGKAYLSTAVTEDGEPKQLVPKTRIRLEFARVPNKNADGPRVYDVVRAHVVATAWAQPPRPANCWPAGVCGSTESAAPRSAANRRFGTRRNG